MAGAAVSASGLPAADARRQDDRPLVPDARKPVTEAERDRMERRAQLLAKVWPVATGRRW
jgi:hypothetical protein